MFRTPPKTAILIADSYGEPFTSLKNDIHPYIWKKLRESGIDVFHVIGARPKTVNRLLNNFTDSFRYKKIWPLQRIVDRVTLLRYKYLTELASIDGSTVNVKVPEGLRYLGIKILAAYKIFDSLNYDFVYKTTSSSILNTNLFLETIEKLSIDENPIYAGSIPKISRRKFISGANLLLNRKAIQILISNQKNWDNSLLDDVAIGRIMESKVVPTELKTLNFATLDDIWNVSDEDFRTTLHFRCKASNIPRNDADIMLEVMRRIEDLERMGK